MSGITSIAVFSLVSAFGAEAAASNEFGDAAARALALNLATHEAADGLLADLRERGHVLVTEAAFAMGIDDPAMEGFISSGSYPELWLYEPAQAVKEEPLVCFAPRSRGASQRTAMTAYDLTGQPVALDVFIAPTVPVIMLRSRGTVGMHLEIAQANAMLRAAGLLSDSSSPDERADDTLTVRLDNIQFTDAGLGFWFDSPEVYAIVSGVLDNNKPQLQLVAMPYVFTSGVNYEPHQILFAWKDFSYAAANIQFFEHDAETNYQTLARELIVAVGALGSLAGHPEIAAIAEIASRIVALMPSSWFADGDDYLDSFYTIERGRDYVNYEGAARNARVSFTSYMLQH